MTLADMDGNETFDPSCLGQADEVGLRCAVRCLFVLLVMHVSV